MPNDRLIIAIGRIERALSRLEQVEMPPANINQHDLHTRHEALKAETRSAISALDLLINQGQASG